MRPKVELVPDDAFAETAFKVIRTFMSTNRMGASAHVARIYRVAKSTTDFAGG